MAECKRMLGTSALPRILQDLLLGFFNDHDRGALVLPDSAPRSRIVAIEGISITLLARAGHAAATCGLSGFVAAVVSVQAPIAKLTRL